MAQKSLKMMCAADAACCMTPMLLAFNAAGCVPHIPNLFLMKPQTTKIANLVMSLHSL
jgi:hypothetical protein